MWQQDGTFVYILHQVGWNKGQPVMANRFTINVQVHKQEDKAEAEKIAKDIADFLNAEHEAMVDKVEKGSCYESNEAYPCYDGCPCKGPLASGTD